MHYRSASGEGHCHSSTLPLSHCAPGANNGQLSMKGTVLSAKSDSDFMICLQSFQGLLIDRSLVYKSYD